MTEANPDPPAKAATALDHRLSGLRTSSPHRRTTTSIELSTASNRSPPTERPANPGHLPPPPRRLLSEPADHEMAATTFCRLAGRSAKRLCLQTVALGRRPMSALAACRRPAPPSSRPRPPASRGGSDRRQPIPGDAPRPDRPLRTASRTTRTAARRCPGRRSASRRAASRAASSGTTPSTSAPSIPPRTACCVSILELNGEEIVPRRPSRRPAAPRHREVVAVQDVHAGACRTLTASTTSP